MDTRTTRERWYSRSLSTKASRRIVIIFGGLLVLFEGWLGRKRILMGEPHYLIAYAAFALGTAALLSALRKVFNDARKAQNPTSFDKLQLWVGVLSGLGVAGFGLFSDYTLYKLDLTSVLGSIFTGIILGWWNGAELKSPVVTD
jgi:hypothetical protein